MSCLGAAAGAGVETTGAGFSNAEVVTGEIGRDVEAVGVL